MRVGELGIGEICLFHFYKRLTFEDKNNYKGIGTNLSQQEVVHPREIVARETDALQLALLLNLLVIRIAIRSRKSPNMIIMVTS